ncbi:MAG TPA: electron transfer flavoprotein subunit alpha/FixB family protein [Polyangiaceae bacterium]|nr:electron transfer flavoprotein subunit alpha/FixB family protein [Polyangiaceae bacterium]
MANVLVVAEFADGKVKKTTHSAITFARQAVEKSGGSFSILVVGAVAAAAAAEVKGFGAAKVIVADDPSFKSYVAERYAPTVAAAAKGFDVVVGTASAYGKDLMPRVAARLGAGYVGDITEVGADGGALTYKRPMFAGNAFGVAKIATPVHVVSVRQSAFQPAEPSGGESPVAEEKAAAVGGAAARVEFLGVETVKSERPELTEARVVVSGGRALKEKFNEVLAPLADALGAAVGASRAACDAGYAPSDLQVGQTGKIVAPQLYFAIGISGAIQHLAGMKGSKVIVAINKDGEAPIFQVADYGLVADLFQAVPELVTKVKAAKAG